MTACVICRRAAGPEKAARSEGGSAAAPCGPVGPASGVSLGFSLPPEQSATRCFPPGFSAGPPIWRVPGLPPDKRLPAVSPSLWNPDSPPPAPGRFSPPRTAGGSASGPSGRRWSSATGLHCPRPTGPPCTPAGECGAAGRSPAAAPMDHGWCTVFPGACARPNRPAPRFSPAGRPHAPLARLPRGSRARAPPAPPPARARPGSGRRNAGASPRPPGQAIGSIVWRSPRYAPAGFNRPAPTVSQTARWVIASSRLVKSATCCSKVATRCRNSSTAPGEDLGSGRGLSVSDPPAPPRWRNASTSSGA